MVSDDEECHFLIVVRTAISRRAKSKSDTKLYGFAYHLSCRITTTTQAVDITRETRISASLTYVQAKLLRPSDINQPKDVKRLKADIAASVESRNRLPYNAEMKRTKMPGCKDSSKGIN